EMEVVLIDQNFDALPSAPDGASDAAAFLAALPNWAFFNSNGNRRIGDGSANNGGIYSFGTTDASDRSLGGIATNGTNDQGWGVCVSNGTANDYTDITVSYVGEQWRDSGN